jgi:hypothetical protein
MDPVTTATAAATAPAKSFWKTITEHPIAAVATILVLLGILFRYRANGEAAVKAHAPSMLKSWLRVSAFLAPFGAAYLWAGDAAAAVAKCCAAPLAHGTAHGGVIAAIVGAILTAFGSLAVGMLFNAADTLDLQDENRGRTITYTPASATQEKALFLNVGKAFDSDGLPLVATAIQFELTTTITQTDTGATLQPDDLSALVDYVIIESPLLGTILDKDVGTGPRLDLLISFLGDGFNNDGSQPIPALPLAGTGLTIATTVTKRFTFPFTTKFLKDPFLTAQFLRALNKTQITVGIAGTGCLSSVSSGATVGGTSTLKGVVKYVPHSHWFRPAFSFFRTDKPAGGTDGLVFRNFGTVGPKSTQQIDALTSIGQVSSLKKLGGNTTIDNITKIIGPELGLDDVQNIDQLVLSRLAAQREGFTGDANYAADGNFARGTAAATGAIPLAGMYALWLKQPALHMDPRNAKVQPAGKEIAIREETSAPMTNNHVFLFHSLRQFSDDAVRMMSGLYGGKIPLANAPAQARRIR